MMEPVPSIKRLSITTTIPSLPSLHAIPEHDQYQRRASESHASRNSPDNSPDDESPRDSPRSSPLDRERRVELGSSLEEDGLTLKKRKKKLFGGFFRRSSEITDEREDERDKEKEKEKDKEGTARERGLTFTYSSPFPSPSFASPMDGIASPVPQVHKRLPLAASAPAGAFILSQVPSPASSPVPTTSQSNSMGRKGGLEKLKALMKEKPDLKQEPQEFTTSVFALVSPRDTNRTKGEKDKESSKEKDGEAKDKHKDKTKKKDKEKEKEKDKDKEKEKEKDGEGTPEKKKGGFLTFNRRRSVSSGASTMQQPSARITEHVSSPSLLSNVIPINHPPPTITSLRELDADVPLDFDLPGHCKESLEALMKVPAGVRLFYSFCVKERYHNMLEFWNQARYFQRGSAIAGDPLNQMLGAPATPSDVKLGAEALFYTYIAKGSPSEMSIQPIIRAQLEKHINEGTIHRDMFDRLTRSLYDEISRESFSRFIKLFAPDKELIQSRKHSASNPPPPIPPPASPTLSSMRSLVRRASTPSAPGLSPSFFMQIPPHSSSPSPSPSPSAFHPLAGTNAHHGSISQPSISPRGSSHPPTLHIPSTLHTPPHHLQTPPHTPPHHGGYQPPPSPTPGHPSHLHHGIYSSSPSHHGFASNFATPTGSPHPLSHPLHSLSMSSQFSTNFPPSPPHHPLSLSSHYPSSPAAHHPLANYYSHHPPSPVPVPASPGAHGTPSPPFLQAPPSPSSSARMQYSISSASSAIHQQNPVSKSGNSPRLPSPREVPRSRKLSISIPILDPPPSLLSLAAPAGERFGIAFNTKRGACQPPCDCEFYQPPGDNGGPCQNCGHFPAIHANLGKVDTLSSSPQEQRMTTTPPLSSTPNLYVTTGFASTSSSSLLMSSTPIGASISTSASNLLSPSTPNPLSASGGARRESLVGRTINDLSPSGGFMPIVPDGETEDIFSGMSSWTLDADEITFSDKIGEGSAAKVYKGVWRNQEVAIKILKNAPDSSELTEFKKELEIMSSLRSPYIIYFFGMVLRPKVCMLMEYCGRKSLYHVMNAKGELGWDRVFAFVAGAVRGINALHNWSPPILHRDLKSLNLLITDSWAIRIADFGLSRFHTGDMATLSKVRGTYAYCAPEVYFGQQYTTKSDIYSMGIVIWELVTRCLRGKYERPYAEHKHIQYDFQILLQAAKENLRPTIPAACPEGLANIIRLCHDPNPDIRPSAVHLLEMLLDCEKVYLDNKKKWDKVKEKPKS